MNCSYSVVIVSIMKSHCYGKKNTCPNFHNNRVFQNNCKLYVLTYSLLIVNNCKFI